MTDTAGLDYPMGAECDLDALVEWRYSGFRQRVVLGFGQPESFTQTFVVGIPNYQPAGARP